MKSVNPSVKLRRSGFTLIEIMIVIAIIGIVISIATTGWIRQRELARQRACQENLSKIDGAKEQWALENGRPGDSEPGWDDLVRADGAGYLKKQPVCPSSGDYTLNIVNELPSCSITEPLDHNASN